MRKILLCDGCEVRNGNLQFGSQLPHGLGIGSVASGKEIARFVKQPPGDRGNQNRIGLGFPSTADEIAEVFGISALWARVTGGIGLLAVASELDQQKVSRPHSLLDRFESALVQVGFGAAPVKPMGGSGLPLLADTGPVR